MYQRKISLLKDMSMLLLGARGSGKTWLLEKELRDASLLWINLLENREFLKYQTRPGLVQEEIREKLKSISPNTQSWVVIDEVQRVPEMLNEVHALIEDPDIGRDVLFALSGSSARKLKRGGANLLAGRALLHNLYPLCADEIGEDFDLMGFLSWGGLPSVLKQSDPLLRSEILETYVAVYLREEIREEQIVRNLDPFSRFLEVAAQTSGKIINYSKVGRDCGVDSRAVARYFQILEETLLGIFLLPYDRSVRKQQGKSPKFYLFDTGVIRALERTINQPITEGSYGFGRLFEHFVLWEIFKNNEYSRKRLKLSYLITKNDVEVDLIVEEPGEPPILVEIKSSKTPQRDDAKYLFGLRDAFPGSEMWVVSRIEREREESGIRFIHWRTALRELFS